MSVLFLVARVLFAAVFVIVPMQVIASSAAVAPGPAHRPGPLPRISVVAASSIAIAGAALVVLGVWPDLGALLIAAYLVPVTVVMHAFWAFEDPGQAKEHRDSFFLNTSLVGGSLIFFWAVNQSQLVPAALVSVPLFDRW